MRKLLLVLWLVLCAHALDILSERNDMYTIGDPETPGVQRMFQNKTITMRCGTTDMGAPALYTITKPDGSTSNMTVTCTPVQYHYFLEEVEYVPETGSLILVEFCNVRNALALNESVTDVLRRVPGGDLIPNNIRSLLAPAPGGGLSTGAKITLGVLGAIGLAGVGFTMACAINPGLGGCSSGLSGEPPGTETLRSDLDKLKGIVGDLQSKRAEYDASFKEWRDASTEFDRRINEAVKDATDAIQSSKDTTSLLNQRANITERQLRDQRTWTQYLYGNVSMDVTTLRTDTETLKLNLESVRDALNESQRIMFESLTTTVDDINVELAKIQNKTEITDTLVYNQIRNLGQKIREVSASVARIYERRDAKRSITKRLQEILTTQLDDGVVPFLEDLGSAGYDILSKPWYTLIDTVSFFKVINSGGTPAATEYKISLYCLADQLLSAKTASLGWNDFVDLMEPGCDYLIDNNCTCYMTYQSSYCLSNTSAILEAAWLQAESLTSATCDVGYSITSSTLQYLRSYEELVTTLQTMCTAPIWTGTQWRVASLRANVVLDVADNTDACTVDYGTIGDIAYAGLNFAYAFGDLIGMGYAVLQRYLDPLSDAVDGVMPGDVSFNEVPFARINGQDANCIQAAVMVVSNETLPVYKLSYLSRVVVVNIDIDGSTHNQYEVTVDSEADFLLPADTIVMGNLFDGNWVYDVPDRAASLEPVSAAREGTVTYMACDTSPANLTCWKTKFSNETFNHFQALNVPSFYKRPKNGTDGRCGGSRLTQGGSWCTRLDNFIITEGASPNELIMTPRSASYVVAPTAVPAGEIVAHSFSTCPTVAIQPALGGKTLSMSNPSSRTIRVAINFVGAVGCGGLFSPSGGYTLDDIYIGPLGTTNKWVPACQYEIPTITATVYYWNTDGVPTECAALTGLDLTTDPTLYLSEEGNVDITYYRSQTVVQLDPVNTGLYDIIGQMNDLIGSTYTTIAYAFSQVGAGLNETSWDRFYSLLAKQRLTDEYVRDLQKSIRDRYNPDGLYNSSYDAEIAALQAAIAAKLNETQTSIDSAKAATEASEGALARIDRAEEALVNATERLRAVEDAYLNATLNFYTSVVEQFEATNQYLSTARLYSFLGGFGFMNFMGDLFTGAYDGILTGAELAVDGVKYLANKAAEAYSGLTGMIGEWFGFLKDGLLFLLVLIAMVVGVKYAINKIQDRKMKQGGYMPLNQQGTVYAGQPQPQQLAPQYQPQQMPAAPPPAQQQQPQPQQVYYAPVAGGAPPPTMDAPTMGSALEHAWNKARRQ